MGASVSYPLVPTEAALRLATARLAEERHGPSTNRQIVDQIVAILLASLHDPATSEPDGTTKRRAARLPDITT